MQTKRTYKVGDQRWYVPGYRDHGLIAIFCTIMDVTDGDTYWLDEPIGHGVDADELLCGDDADIEMMTRYESDGQKSPATKLSVFRERGEAFISATWEKTGKPHPGFALRPNKKIWKEWRNPQMILDRRRGAIKAAAIKFDGKVYWVPATGRHNHVMNKIMEENPDLKNCHGGEQGFITQDNAFVDRIEGARIALESGQIKKLNWGPELFSEDLW